MACPMKTFTIVNYASVWSLTYDRNLRSKRLLATLAKAGHTLRSKLKFGNTGNTIIVPTIVKRIAQATAKGTRQLFAKFLGVN